MDEIIILLKPLIQSYNRRKIFKEKLAVMTTHILDTTLEKLLQIKKKVLCHHKNQVNKMLIRKLVQ